MRYLHPPLKVQSSFGTNGVSFSFVSRGASPRTLNGGSYLMICFFGHVRNRYQLNSQGNANKWFGSIHEQKSINKKTQKPKQNGEIFACIENCDILFHGGVCMYT